MGVVRAVDGVSGERAGALSGMTQTDAVLEFLRTRGPLTQPMAQEELGCLRLGARIWDLKQRGYAIATELVELPSGQRVAEYSLTASGGSSGSSTLLPRREGSSTLLKGEGDGGSEASALLPGGSSGSFAGSRGDGGGGLSVEGGSEGVVGGSEAGAMAGSGAGLRDGLTLDAALGVFGDLVMSLGVSPTVREFGAALGVSSESVAHRWVRVLEREGLLAANAQLGPGSVRGWVVTCVGFERLYGVERGRRLAAEARCVVLEGGRRGGGLIWSSGGCGGGEWGGFLRSAR